MKQNSLSLVCAPKVKTTVGKTYISTNADMSGPQNEGKTIYTTLCWQVSVNAIAPPGLLEINL